MCLRSGIHEVNVWTKIVSVCRYAFNVGQYCHPLQWKCNFEIINVHCNISKAFTLTQPVAPYSFMWLFHAEFLNHAALILHTLQLFAYVTQMFISVNWVCKYLRMYQLHFISYEIHETMGEH